MDNNAGFNMYVNGGSSNGSGKSAGNPANVEFRNGASIENIYWYDGEADVPASDQRSLVVNGHCAIGNIQSTNRSGLRICNNGGTPTVLKINSISGKTTFESSNGNPTIDISADPQAYIFFATSGNWFRVAGSDIMD